MLMISCLGFKPRSEQRRDEQEEGERIARRADDERAEFGLQFAQFGAGCFWGLELAFQRVVGVIKTEVGYSQGFVHRPTYREVCEGMSGHAEVVRIVYDPSVCTYDALLSVFWAMHFGRRRHRQSKGDQYRSGIYFYNTEQEKKAMQSVARAKEMEIEEEEEMIEMSAASVEVAPARTFYRAEAFHQQYLSKGGRFGFRQSPAKRCTDPIRPYG